ncbi:MAG: transposase [Bacilli bacterium]
MNRKEKREKKEEINLLNELVTIMKQYFPDLINKFEGLTDTRNQSYITYQMKVIFMVRLMGLMCEMKSMNGMTRDLNTEKAINNIAKICKVKLEEIPHCDTINDVFQNINIEELEEIRKYMITKIIRSKMVNRYRIRNRYYHIIVDGTGLATSRKKYNKNCLVKNKTDKKGQKYQEYSTYVLEAKLVVGNMVFSIGSEFVENVNIHTIKSFKKVLERKYKLKGKVMKNLSIENYKQDCELKAFKRLAEKIKKAFPKLKIVISGDALYACQTVLEICKKYDWKYIIRFKEGAIPTLYKEYLKIVENDNECNKENYEFVTGIDYQDYKVNIIKYIEKKKDKSTEFMYMTDLPITNKNIKESISLGRKRWKIENEGFNIQKNGTFDIGHLYSKNAIAIKVHYILIQIAHLLRQLLEKGTKEIKELKLKIEEISQEIKQKLTSTNINLTEHKRIQLRFDV